MKYLDAFLGHADAPEGAPQRLPKLTQPPFGSSVSDPPPALEPPQREACTGCGRTDWVVTVVMEDGTRLCRRCLSGEKPPVYAAGRTCR